MKLGFISIGEVVTVGVGEVEALDAADGEDVTVGDAEVLDAAVAEVVGTGVAVTNKEVFLTGAFTSQVSRKTKATSTISVEVRAAGPTTKVNLVGTALPAWTMVGFFVEAAGLTQELTGTLLVDDLPFPELPLESA